MSHLPCPVADRVRIHSADDAAALFAALAAGDEERCGFAYLDPEWMLLGARETPSGNAHSVGMPLRDVIADVLSLGASAVVMVHNHPGGDLSPSEADVAVTRRLITALEAIDVRLVDHVVLGRAGRASMRERGML